MRSKGEKRGGFILVENLDVVRTKINVMAS